VNGYDFLMNCGWYALTKINLGKNYFNYFFELCNIKFLFFSNNFLIGFYYFEILLFWRVSFLDRMILDRMFINKLVSNLSKWILHFFLKKE